jgi:negative regulator of flagellin synthesis FlgM
VQEINRIGGPLQPQKAENVEKVEKKAKIKQSAPGESIDISLNIAEMIKTAKESPEIREQLVNEIKKAVEQNIYNIDVNRIARHLLREM